ncbi:MAG: protein kinase [Deltaproteobacteria bacterium]|nr:protein kinase [Deltaproteobacteria bacterium]
MGGTVEQVMTEEGATNDPMVGRTIEGKYEIVRRIGEGGMGSVYEARHLLLGKKLAVKVLLPEVAGDPEVVQRFHNEARIAASLGHENVIEITDMGTLPSGSPFIVMELLQGESLAQRLEEVGRLPTSEAVRILAPVLDALAVVHEAGVVHRDLKPDNVFLARRSGAEGTRTVVKLLDFGISKLRCAETGNFHLTRTGTVLGTPYYMSPEQASGCKDLDQRADLYAVGVMLYEMLVGRRPFEGDTYNALLAAILTRDPPRPRALCPDIPEALEAVVLRAMSREAAQRFPTASDFLHALAPFGPAGVVPRSSPSRLAPLPSRSAVGTPAARSVEREGGAPPRRAGIAWAAAGLVVVAAGAAALFVLRPWEGGSTDSPTPPGLENPLAARAPAPAIPGPSPVPALPPGPSPSALPATADAGAQGAPPPDAGVPPNPTVAAAPDASIEAVAPPDGPDGGPAPVDAERPPPPQDARRPVDRAAVRQDAAPVEPGLPAQPDAGIARSRFESARGDVRACFGAGAGRVSCSVEFSGETGRMTSANVTSQPARPGLATCVRDALRRVQLPPFSSAATTLQHVYDFAPAGAATSDAGGTEVIRTVIEEYDEPPHP